MTTLALALCQTLLWAGLYYIFPALLVQMEAGTGWTRPDLALSFTMAALVSALAAPLAGRLIDAGHGRALMTGGTLLGAGALGMLSLAETLAAFRMAWLAIGLAMAACLYQPLFAILTRSGAATARRRITHVTLIAGFASTLAFPSAAALAECVGWRGAVLAWAAVLALVAAPLGWVALGALGGAAAPAPAPTGTALPLPWARRAFWVMLLGLPCLAMNHAILVAHLLPLLAERAVAGPLALLAISAIGPMQVAGRLALLAAGRHVPALGMTLLAFAAAALASAALLAGAAPGVPAVFVLALFVLLQGGAMGMTSILRPVLVADRFGQARYGVVAGTLALPWLAAAALAPWLGALVWDRAGYDAVLWLTLGLALAGGLVLSLLRGTDRFDK